MKHPRILSQIENTKWMITPEALETVWNIVSQDMTVDTVEAYLRFHSTSEEARAAITSTLGMPVFNNGLSYRNGTTGTIRIDGPIVPRSDSLSAASGMVSIDSLTADFKEFDADPTVERIVLLVDSPGGAITGITEFASLVKASTKPTVGYVYGRANSAAYLIISATDKIVSADMGEVGSVGVVATYRQSKDSSKIEIVSAQSPQKRPDLSTEEGRAGVQQVVNELTDVFVDTVAQNRGVTSEKVLADFGKGGTVVAARALSVGMIDSIATLESVFNQSADNQLTIDQQPATAGTTRRAEMLKEFLAENPAAAAEYENALKAARDEGLRKGEKEVNARVAEASKFLTSTAYGESINNLAASVISGESTLGELKSAVAVYDGMRQQLESLAAKLDTQDSSVGNTGGPAVAGEIDYAAELAEDNKLRKLQGMKPLKVEV